MKSLIAKLALVAMLACAATSWAYFPYGYFKKDGSGFIPVRYDLSKLPNSTLTFHLNIDGLWLLPENHPKDALFADLKAALDAWNVSTSALRLRPGGFTHLTKFSGPAGLVSFTPEIPPGIAVLEGYETGPLPTDDSVAFIPITASFIKLPHLVDELGAYGLLNALASGIGGSIGLNNSHIMGVRTQVVYTNNRGRLSADDVAGISSLYPTDDFDRITGQYAGWVTGPKGPVVLGAVTAYNDSVAVGTYTNPDGTFRIRGLPPGPYRLFIQPLMAGIRGGGSTDPNLIGPQTKLGGGAVTPSLEFGANFLTVYGEYAYSESGARVLDVAAGDRVYARIWGVPGRGNKGMDALDAVSNPAGQSWVPAVWVQQGGKVSVLVEAHKMVKMVTVDDHKVPTVDVQVGFTGSGLSTSLLTGGVDDSPTAPWYDSSLSFTVSAAPDATPSLRSIVYVGLPDAKNPGLPELYFSAGYVHVVAGPPPRVTSISPTSGIGGTTVTITGSGFTDSSKVFFDGLPATIVSRSPTSLMVTAPRGAAGHGSGIFVNNADGQGSDFSVNAGVRLDDGRPKDLTNLVRFTYDPAIPAPAIAVAPTSVTSGQKLLIRVVGTNTHFVQGETFVGFGSGDVVVNSVTVTSPTSLAADVTVNAKIGEGFPVTAVTGEEVAFLKDAFGVVPPPAPEIAVAPTSVTRGQRLLIRVTGTNTHFVQDKTVVSFGSADVVVHSVTVTSPTSLAADVTVNAKIGEGVQVTVVTGEEAASLRNAFGVVAPPAPEIAVAPTSVTRGQRLLIRVVGTNTHFVQDQTVVGFGSADVVVHSVTVASPTSLTADVTVNAKIGDAFQVTVVTGEETALLRNALRVVPLLPLTLQVVSGNGQIGAAGSQLPVPLVVRAQDATGSPLSGVKVNFSVQAGGGTISPTSAITDDKGQASTVLTLGPAVGFNAVVAAADQFPSAGFVLAGGGASAANLQVTGSGDSQSAIAGQDLPNPLVLTVMDALTKRRLAGFPITWRVTRGGGVVTPAFTLTDAGGTATVRWTLGPTSGAQTLEAALSGFSPIVFKADAQGGSGAPSVRANGVVNAAALDTVPRSISPGSLVSIFGAGLLPAQTGASPGFWPGSDQIRTLFGGTEVTFDGVRGPILYARDDQLNVQVPFEVGGNSTVQMAVTVGGIRSNTVALDVQPAAPGLFTADSSGRGAAAALNPDNSRNSASNPVSRGQVIQLFTTGLGPLGPPVATGRAAPSGALLPLAVYVPRVTIGGISASVEYAGLAPGYVGLWQVNVLVPSNAPTGEQPVLLETCAQRSNTATVFVR